MYKSSIGKIRLQVEDTKTRSWYNNSVIGDDEALHANTSPPPTPTPTRLCSLDPLEPHFYVVEISQ